MELEIGIPTELGCVLSIYSLTRPIVGQLGDSLHSRRIGEARKVAANNNNSDYSNSTDQATNERRAKRPSTNERAQLASDPLDTASSLRPLIPLLSLCSRPLDQDHVERI